MSRKAYIRTMTTMESGIPYREVDVEAIRKGFDLAFPGKRSLARTKPVKDFPDMSEHWLMLDEYSDW